MIIVYYEEMSTHSPERNRELRETLFLSSFELVLKTSHLYEPWIKPTADVMITMHPVTGAEVELRLINVDFEMSERRVR